MLNALRTGSWLTSLRVRVVCVVLLALLVARIIALSVSSHGLMDMHGKPIGTDFANIYAAGTYVLEGAPEKPFVPALQYQREQEIFGSKVQFYGWHYPPYFLVVAGVLALLPYILSLIVWQLVTMAFYVRACWAVLPQRAILLPVLAFPAGIVNIAHGHNGFLTAALLIGALYWLKPRPVLAGVLIALLAYKPQFGMLIPLALIAGRHWRSFASATVTLIAMTIATTIAYEHWVWRAFRDSLEFTQTVILEQGATGFFKIQSMFAFVRLLGGEVSLAYTLQALLTLVVAWGVWRLWRAPQIADELRYAFLAVACVLATPYSLDYDLMALAAALVFLVKHAWREGFAPYEKTLLGFVWFVPLITRNAAEYFYVPLGLIAMMLLATLIYRRALKV
jgi:hypothetical protein